MPEYQLVEKNKNIAERNFFDFVCFRSGLKLLIMAKPNILDVILSTINDVKQKNKANPREETAHPNVFDILKEKLGELDTNIQNKRVEKGKKPVSILDLIKNQIEAAKKHNKADLNVPTAPPSVFDRITKKVDDRTKRVADAGIRRVIEEYNLDVSRVPRKTLMQIKSQYDGDLRSMNYQYAQNIDKLVKSSYFK